MYKYFVKMDHVIIRMDTNGTSAKCIYPLKTTAPCSIILSSMTSVTKMLLVILLSMFNDTTVYCGDQIDVLITHCAPIQLAETFAHSQNLHVSFMM